MRSRSFDTRLECDKPRHGALQVGHKHDTNYRGRRQAKEMQGGHQIFYKLAYMVASIYGQALSMRPT